MKAALIDGEIIVQDQAGHLTLAGLQADFKVGRHKWMIYYAFDLMHCGGVDLQAVHLLRRKQMLAELIAANHKTKALLG